MKKCSKIYSFITCLFGAFLFCLAMNVNNVSADYDNKPGEVSEVVDNVTVVNFKYDYISVFDELGNFYKGKEIFDGGNSLKNQRFYSGHSIELKVDHVDKLFFWSKDDDRTMIYKYSQQFGDFNIAVKSFINSSGTYTIKEDGLYKVVYELGDEKRINYISISSDIHSGEIIVEKYTSTSAYANFEFLLSLKDAYDLREYSYYYAFGTNPETLSYKPFAVFSDEEKNVPGPLLEIDKKNISVVIGKEDQCKDDEEKHLFIKIDKNLSGKKDYTGSVLVTKNKYKLVENIEAYVYVVDDQGNEIKDKLYFKKGDTINGQIKFNAPVKFADLKVSLNGGSNYFDLKDVNEPTKVVDFSYVVVDSNDGKGELVIMTKNNQSAIVECEGFSVPVVGYIKADIVIDVSDPLVDFEGDEPMYQYKNEYNVEIHYSDSNLKSVEYYAKECVTYRADECLDGWDSSYEKTFKLTPTDVTESYVSFKLSKSNIGDFNGKEIVVFVKVSDQVGNSKVYKKSGYLVDNVILDGDKNSIIVENNIVENDVVVGKMLQVEVYDKYEISSISHNIGKGGTCYISDSEEDKDIYICYSARENYFSTVVDIELIDKYGNKEIVSKLFKYNNLSKSQIDVGGYKFNVYDDREYDAESINMSNYVGVDDARLTLNQQILNELDGLIKLSAQSNITDYKRSLVYKDVNKEVVLVENINDQLIVPTFLEIIRKIEMFDENYCALKGNKCDVSVYLKYEYKIDDDIEQIRFVKLNFLDNFFKLEMSNFNAVIDVDVYGVYQSIDYNVVDVLNISVSKDKLTVKQNVEFVGEDGQLSKVDSVDTKKVGMYKVEEYVVGENNSSYPLVYVVNVVDKIAPVIKLKEKGALIISKGESIGDFLAWVEASDNYSDDLTIESSWDVPFDNKKTGRYVISFYAVDSSGNKSEVVSRTVIVEYNKNFKTYLIVGGIVLLVFIVVAIGTVKEFKKQKNQK